MMRKSTLVAMGLLLGTAGVRAQYTPVALTGFNADVIANGVGPATGSTSTNADNGTYGLVAKNFQAVAGNAFPTYGLPVDGTINSINTSGVTFQLRHYDSSNVLRLVTAAPTGTLSLSTPAPATSIYLLAYSGSGNSTASVTVSFTDGTTQAATLTISDWYYNTGYAIRGIGRVSLSGNNILEGDALDPRLYEYRIVVAAANAGKTISSLSFTKTNTTATLIGVLAATLYQDPYAYAPVAVTGFNADVIANGTGAPAASTNSDVDNATPPYVFIAADYKYSASCSAPTRYLPQNGLITSNLNSSLSFQLRHYDSTNDLRLTGAGAGTLALTSPRAASTVYLLAVGGGGAARINATVSFTDGSVQDFSSLDIGDWYGGTTNIATQGIGRVPRTATACGNLETSTSSPKLFQIPLNISAANTGKLISSITITRVNGLSGYEGIPNILAVSVAYPNPALPIALKQFNGYRSTTGNQLEWLTSSEWQNAGFEIERSANGIHFSKIGFVASKAVNGNSSSEIRYGFADHTPAAAYYRLKQVDKDGKAIHSRILFIKGLYTGEIEVSALYPNPAKGGLQVQVAAVKDEKLTLWIVDAAGKVVLQKAVQVSAGTNRLGLDVHQLAPGKYFLSINGAGTTSTVSSFVKD